MVKARIPKSLTLRLGAWTPVLGMTAENRLENHLIWHPRRAYLNRLGVHPSLKTQFWMGILRIDSAVRGHAIGYVGRDDVRYSEDYRLEGHGHLTMTVGVVGRNSTVTHRSALALR